MSEATSKGVDPEVEKLAESTKQFLAHYVPPSPSGATPGMAYEKYYEAATEEQPRHDLHLPPLGPCGDFQQVPVELYLSRLAGSPFKNALTGSRTAHCTSAQAYKHTAFADFFRFSAYHRQSRMQLDHVLIGHRLCCVRWFRWWRRDRIPCSRWRSDAVCCRLRIQAIAQGWKFNNHD
jgi:hypothetical protein